MWWFRLSATVGHWMYYMGDRWMHGHSWLPFTVLPLSCIIFIFWLYTCFILYMLQGMILSTFLLPVIYLCGRIVEVIKRKGYTLFKCQHSCMKIFSWILLCIKCGCEVVLKCPVQNFSVPLRPCGRPCWLMYWFMPHYLKLFIILMGTGLLSGRILGSWPQWSWVHTSNHGSCSVREVALSCHCNGATWSQLSTSGDSLIPQPFFLLLFFFCICVTKFCHSLWSTKTRITI